MSAGSRPRRARRRSVSRRLSPQSISTRVRSACATRQLPPEPLASEAKRSNLLQLLKQQREDALRGFRAVGGAILVEHVDLARGTRLADLHAVLLGLDFRVAREPACQDAARVLLGVRIGVAHEVDALLAVAVLDGEADAVERQTDAPPDAVEGLEHFQLLGAVHALADLRAALLLRDGGRGERARLLLLRAQAHHQAPQEFRLELRIGLARLPFRIAGRVALRVAHGGVDLHHAAVTDVHLGRLAVRGAIEPGAVLVALRSRIEGIERLAEEATHAALRQAGAAFRPFGLHDAELRQLELDEEAVLLPELAHQRPELLRRLVYHQPALRAGALDAHVLGLRQQRRGRRRRPRLRVATLRLVIGERRRRLAGFRDDVAVVARGRCQIGRHLERRQRRGGLVLDLAFHPFVDARAATEQEHARENRNPLLHQLPRPSTTRNPGKAIPASCSASRTVSWNFSASGDSGSRRPYSIMPICASAHFTGIGFASTNRRWCSGSSLRFRSRAFFTSPTSAAAHI